MAKLALARLDSNSLGVALRFSAWGNRLARRVGNWKRQRPFMSRTVTVVRADVRQVLATLAAFGFDGVAVDAVVSEIDSTLSLIGEHPVTTMLNWSTVMPWIAHQIGQELGATKFEEIFRANTA
jgi:hypothetical protein